MPALISQALQSHAQLDTLLLILKKQNAPSAHPAHIAKPQMIYHNLVSLDSTAWGVSQNASPARLASSARPSLIFQSRVPRAPTRTEGQTLAQRALLVTHVKTLPIQPTRLPALKGSTAKLAQPNATIALPDSNAPLLARRRSAQMGSTALLINFPALSAVRATHVHRNMKTLFFAHQVTIAVLGIRNNSLLMLFTDHAPFVKLATIALVQGLQNYHAQIVNIAPLGPHRARLAPSDTCARPLPIFLKFVLTGTTMTIVNKLARYANFSI